MKNYVIIFSSWILISWTATIIFRAPSICGTSGATRENVERIAARYYHRAKWYRKWSPSYVIPFLKPGEYAALKCSETDAINLAAASSRYVAPRVQGKRPARSPSWQPVRKLSQAREFYTHAPGESRRSCPLANRASRRVSSRRDLMVLGTVAERDGKVGLVASKVEQWDSRHRVRDDRIVRAMEHTVDHRDTNPLDSLDLLPVRSRSGSVPALHAGYASRRSQHPNGRFY